MLQAKNVCLTSWQEFVPTLKSELRLAGYNEQFVIIREYDANLTSLVLRRGTDRNRRSAVWYWDGDVDHRGDRLSPAKIAYAWTIDLNLDPPKRTDSTDIDGYFLKDDSLKPPRDGKAVAVYKAKGLGRRSLYEYEFLIAPKDALIAVFTLHEQPSVHKKR